MFPNYNKTRRQYITPKIILEEILEEQGLLRNSWDQSATTETGRGEGDGNSESGGRGEGGSAKSTVSDDFVLDFYGD